MNINKIIKPTTNKNLYSHAHISVQNVLLSYIRDWFVYGMDDQYWPFYKQYNTNTILNQCRVFPTDLAMGLSIKVDEPTALSKTLKTL